MALSEIEKLERRYAENPQGLTFAPLAEVHRKNGDVTRALELLRPGLTLHPDYIPASIVLGRCHLDLGDLPASEAAFTHVLGLDGENVIALKALADITERQGRFDEAERWLRTLLEIDRSNDEARDQLGRVEATRRQTESSAVTLPASEATTAEAPVEETATTAEPVSEVSADPTAAVMGGAAEREPLADAASSSPGQGDGVPHEPMLGWVTESGSTENIEAVPLDLEELQTSTDLDAVRPEGIQLEQPVSLEDPVEPLAGLVGRDDHSDGRGAIEAAGEFRVEMAEDIVLNSSGGGEFQVANAAEELLDMRGLHEAEAPLPEPPAMVAGDTADADARDEAVLGAAAEVSSQPASESVAPGSVASESVALESVAPEDGAQRLVAQEKFRAEVDGGTRAEPPEVVTQAPTEAADITSPEPVPAAAEAPAPWSPPVAEPPRQPEPELVVTESMAELLLQQGHVGEALIVYRHLQSRSGGESRFQEKIVELEHAAAEATRAPAPAAAEQVSAVPEPAPTEAAAPARVYSVQLTHGQSVQGLLRNLLAARPPAMAAGPPVHGTAPRAGSGGAEGAPTRPAHDSLSLSSVFGEESTPTPPAVPAAGPSGPAQGGVSYDEFFGAAGGAGASSAQRPARASDGKSDDLDQFHAWLQNLKR